GRGRPHLVGQFPRPDPRSGRAAMTPATPSDLAATWQAIWPQALAAWSPFTLLRPPLFLEERQAAERGMAGQLAAIRLTDQTVIVNPTTLRNMHLEGHALAVLAHEIGHHVYVPGNLADNARMIAAIKPVLFGLPADTPAFVANLYGDLL